MNKSRAFLNLYNRVMDPPLYERDSKSIVEEFKKMGEKNTLVYLNSLSNTQPVTKIKWLTSLKEIAFNA